MLRIFYVALLLMVSSTSFAQKEQWISGVKVVSVGLNWFSDIRATVELPASVNWLSVCPTADNGDGTVEVYFNQSSTTENWMFSVLTAAHSQGKTVQLLDYTATPKCNASQGIHIYGARIE